MQGTVVHRETKRTVLGLGGGTHRERTGAFESSELSNEWAYWLRNKTGFEEWFRDRQ